MDIKILGNKGEEKVGKMTKLLEYMSTFDYRGLSQIINNILDSINNTVVDIKFDNSLSSIKKASNPSFKVEDLLKPFDKVYSSNEVRLKCPNELKKDALNKFSKKVEENPNIFGTKIKDIITLDGMRIVFDGGFALVRQSNTEPVFTLRFEAKTQEESDKIDKITIETLENCIEKDTVA